MKKNKQTKVVAILALCLSVVGLTLGFAAFSNALTISSSAIVSPDESDFKLVLYGIPNAVREPEFDPENIDLSLFTSKTAIGPFLSTHEDGTVGVLDNDNLAIKNITAKFEGPDEDPYIEYYFLLKNEGKYDAYINANDFQLPTPTCTAEEGTTNSLVQEACKSIRLALIFKYYENNSSELTIITEKMDENGNIKLGVGETWVGIIETGYSYGGARADGPFSVQWGDIELEFSTTKK